MIDEPSVITVAERAAAVIRITVPRPEMQSVMGPAIRELREVLRAQDIAPSGALFVHHLTMDDAVFDFEVGISVDRAVSAAGRVRPGLLPAGLVARTTYRGGYEGLSTAWVAFRRWIEDHRFERTADLWEIYAAGPESSGSPADWRTELFQPVRREPGTSGH